MSQASTSSLASDVVRAARALVDTPYRHQGRSKKGMDCAGIVITVGKTLGLLDFDITDYERWPDGKTLRSLCEEYGEERDKRFMRPGYVVLIAFKGQEQHLGIIGDYPQAEGEVSLIHAYAGAGKVVEHRLDDKWRNRVVAAYVYKGVA